jgi:hypothetical protein
METLEDALSYFCRLTSYNNEPVEVVKAFVAALRIMGPDNVGPEKPGAVGVGPKGICWAVERQMPNLLETEGTVEAWVGFQIRWANVRDTSHEDGVFWCMYRALAETKPMPKWEEHALRATFGDRPDDARTLSLLVEQLREHPTE